MKFFVHDPPEQTLGQKIFSSIVCAGLGLAALAGFWLAAAGNQARATTALDPVATNLALGISGASSTNTGLTATPVEKGGLAGKVGWIPIFGDQGSFGITADSVGWRVQARHVAASKNYTAIDPAPVQRLSNT